METKAGTSSATLDLDNSEITRRVQRARHAMEQIADADQARLDAIVTAIAWAIYRDDRARELAEIAVRDTGLGNVDDKVVKNQRKTLGTLNDLIGVKTVGVIAEEPHLGITTWAKPVGVVGSITPSTNPGATPANQAMMAVKSGNAIIISPSPTGYETATRLAQFVWEELDKVDAPRGLFQVVDRPISFSKAIQLAEQVDLILATGDQQNVRNAYKSGTPCIGVGRGNVSVIVDDTADLASAAAKIAASKTFDNATSCSSENSVIVDRSRYADLMSELKQVGARHCTGSEVTLVREKLFANGELSRDFVGKSIQEVCSVLGFNTADLDCRFLTVDGSGVGQSDPLSGEKLSLVLTVYAVADFDEAVILANQILQYQGIGHSVGIHTASDERARELAAASPVGRVLVNQAHTFGNGGGFDNNLPFSLSMGCGTWAGNSISGNLSYREFFNTTRLVRTVVKPQPDPKVLFAGLS